MSERRWRTAKYEKLYLDEYVTVTDLHQVFASYFVFYGHHRQHSSLDRQAPAEVHLSG